jgi:1,5-anhydro-D-fructose reductase (1,5-anhydro-D-mannitol-forming)
VEDARRESTDGRVIGWGFIGASSWASRYLVPAVRAVPGCCPVGVFSSSPARGEGFAAASGLPRSYASLDELLADPEIDAVYVSTTNDLHAEQTIAAARAGKHVLCEKPIATRVADARRMLAECEAAGVVLAVDHHLRGSPAIVAMREAIASGAIGEVVAGRVFHATSLPEELRTWRLERADAGAGVVLDLTVHDVDTIRFLLDDEVDEVVAIDANQGLAVTGIADSAMSVVRMRGGQLVSLHDAFTVPYAGTGIEIHGEKGSLIGRDVLDAEPVGTVLLRDADGERAVDVPSIPSLYARAVERFVTAVRTGSPPLASGADGLAALEVALAIVAAAREGRSVRPAHD